jgi:hypothetical protein
MLLQDGHSIYQGQISEIPSYLSTQLGCKIKRFSNPSDYIIRMAQNPRSCNKDLTLNIMIAKYNQVLRPEIDEGIKNREGRFMHIQTNFKDF